MIIFLAIIQIILALIISGSIVFSKSGGNPITAITNNFTGGSLNFKNKLNLRFGTKILFLLIGLFFLNSVVLTKKINQEQVKTTIAYNVSKGGKLDSANRSVNSKGEDIDNSNLNQKDLSDKNTNESIKEENKKNLSQPVNKKIDEKNKDSGSNKVPF